MADLCLVTTCMGRLSHLQQTLPANSSQPGTASVVVDYSCPQQGGLWVEQQHPEVRVVRVPGQTLFSISQARNRGAATAQEPWLCFVDADTILEPGFTEFIRPLLQPGGFYVAQPRVNELCGLVVCPRDAFLRIGGYDEVIQGYGSEDYDLYNRLERAGLALRYFPAALARALPHDNDMRTQFYVVKDRLISMTINQLYIQAKLDLMQVLGRPLAVEERRALYQQVEPVVHNMIHTRQKQTLVVPFKSMKSVLGLPIETKLAWSISLPNKPAPA